jgi:hypothetical protein
MHYQTAQLSELPCEAEHQPWGKPTRNSHRPNRPAKGLDLLCDHPTVPEREEVEMEMLSIRVPSKLDQQFLHSAHVELTDDMDNIDFERCRHS